MSVIIETIVENSAGYGYLGEWGLSLLVTTDELKVLFDTGMGKTIAHNADRLGVRFEDINAIVLSHGHIDHTGGLGRVLSRSGPKPVFAHPGVWDRKLSVRSDRKGKDISMPFSRDDLEGMGAMFTEVTRPMNLSPRIVLSGEVPMGTDFERVDRGLYLDSEDGRVEDTMADELALAVKTSRGLVIVLGCAHRGVINTIRHFQTFIGEERIHAVIGGLHLGHASDKRIDRTVDELKSIGITTVASTHCTGLRASAKLYLAFGDKFKENHAGSRIVLD